MKIEYKVSDELHNRMVRLIPAGGTLYVLFGFGVLKFSHLPIYYIWSHLFVMVMGWIFWFIAKRPAMRDVRGHWIMAISGLAAAQSYFLSYLSDFNWFVLCSTFLVVTAALQTLTGFKRSIVASHHFVHTLLLAWISYFAFEFEQWIGVASMSIIFYAWMYLNAMAQFNVYYNYQVEKEKIKREKKRSDTFYRALKKLALTAISDSEGNIVIANSNFTRILGTTTNLGEVLDWEDILKSGLHFREELKISTNGEETYLDVHIVPFGHQEQEEDMNATTNDEEAYLFLAMDITKSKLDQELLKKQEENLIRQEQLAALGQLASGIAHEINNPLAVISTSTKLFEKMLGSGKYSIDGLLDINKKVYEMVVRMTSIINGVKNLARDPDLDDFQWVKIGDLLGDVQNFYLEMIRAKGITFDLEWPSEDIQNRKIHVMPVQINQVIINLLTNARDAVQDQPEKWIKVKIDFDKKFIYVRVRDSGPGIDPKLKEKIFNPFFTTKEIGKGTGLGLSLSNTIVRRHKGQIYVDAGEVHTCFVVQLPL